MVLIDNLYARLAGRKSTPEKRDFGMMNKQMLYGAFLASVMSVGSAVAAEGGVSLGGTRLVFDGSKDAASMTVTNSSAADVWLMRFWVSPYGDDTGDDGKTASVPFAVTPPLYRLDPKAAVQLRVNRLSDSLPADRESIFYLNNLAIPPKKGEKSYMKAVQSGLQFAVNSRIKLFYRPGPLNNPDAVSAAPSKLTASASGKDVLVKNPTPYYITMVSVTINGKSAAVEGGDSMVAPFGELKFASPVAHGTLKYATVNDRGMTTDALTKTF